MLYLESVGTPIITDELSLGNEVCVKESHKTYANTIFFIAEIHYENNKTKIFGRKIPGTHCSEMIPQMSCAKYKEKFPCPIPLIGAFEPEELESLNF